MVVPTVYCNIKVINFVIPIVVATIHVVVGMIALKAKVNHDIANF